MRNGELHWRCIGERCLESATGDRWGCSWARLMVDPDVTRRGAWPVARGDAPRRTSESGEEERLPAIRTPEALRMPGAGRERAHSS